MMILPFSAPARHSYPDADAAQRLRADPDEPAQVAIVNPQQAQLAQVIHGEQRLAGRPLVGGL